MRWRRIRRIHSRNRRRCQKCWKTWSFAKESWAALIASRISTVIEQWNISEVERLLDWCGEQGFVFAAQSAQMEKMPNLALLQNPKYQALVDKIVERCRKGVQPINGTARTIETLLRFGYFQAIRRCFRGCTRTAMYFNPCEPLRIGPRAICCGMGSLKKIFARGEEDLWGYSAVPRDLLPVRKRAFTLLRE